MPNYSLTVTNNSNYPGDVCVYQNDPDISDPTVMSLAWFCKYIYPTTSVTFTWSIDYAFVWDNKGTLIPGVIFEAAQTWAADLSLKNQVTLTHDNNNNAFTFKDQTQNPQGGGSLYLLQDAMIPCGQASAGVAMSGSGIYACEARPNWQFVFTPHPTYWVTFGTYTQGQVMDTTSISRDQQVDFPANVFEREVVLNEDNTWTVMP